MNGQSQLEEQKPESSTVWEEGEGSCSRDEGRSIYDQHARFAGEFDLIGFGVMRVNVPELGILEVFPNDFRETQK